MRPLPARLLALSVLALAVGCARESNVPPLPGSAFGPDLEAIRRYELGHIRLTRPVTSPEWKSVRTQNSVTKREVELPTVLSAADIERYRKAFAAQARGDWDAADAEIKKLENPILAGHVLRERYMARSYKSNYTQLAQWMARYGDQPGADDVHKFARKKMPRKAKAPRAPWGDRLRPRPIYWGNVTAVYLPAPRLKRRDRRRALYLRRRLDRDIRRDRLTSVEKRLAGKGVERLLGSARYDNYRMRLARRWFQFGKYGKAFKLAHAAARRSGKHITNTHWIAGLAGWSTKRFKEAAEHFTKVADAPNEHEWYQSAGAYWAARAYDAVGDTANAGRWYNRAAAYSRSFYGFLARRKLRLKPDFDWSYPKADPDHLKKIRDSAGGKRALALIQVGRYDLAGEELSRSYFQNGEKMAETYLSLAAAGRLSALAYNVGVRLKARDNRRFDLALYPVPNWKPAGGFAADRALVYAVMRQESEFKAGAKSPAGARGLMQLMPRTASFIGADRSLRRRNISRLYDPVYNVTLGQKFLKFLLDQPGIGNNLFFALAAYNAGEGNLAKWTERDDPLLFIEAMHLKETRIYVERVMYNLWIYRFRLGQPTPSLDDLVAGRWPKYRPLDAD